MNWENESTVVLRATFAAAIQEVAEQDTWCFGGLVAVRAHGGLGLDDDTVDIITDDMAVLNAVQEVMGVQPRVKSAAGVPNMPVYVYPNNVRVYRLGVANNTKTVQLDNGRSVPIASPVLTAVCLLNALALGADECRLYQLYSLLRCRLFTENTLRDIIDTFVDTVDVMVLLELVSNLSECEHTEARYVVLDWVSDYIRASVS